MTIRDYAWADDGAVVKVYVPLPGVRKDATTVEIRDDGVDLRSTVAAAVYVLRLRKLFDRVYPSASSYKVPESKDKVADPSRSGRWRTTTARATGRGRRCTLALARRRSAG